MSSHVTHGADEAGPLELESLLAHGDVEPFLERFRLLVQRLDDRRDGAEDDDRPRKP
jgi:hypothetical protein